MKANFQDGLFAKTERCVIRRLPCTRMGDEDYKRISHALFNQDVLSYDAALALEAECLQALSELAHDELNIRRSWFLEEKLGMWLFYVRLSAPWSYTNHRGWRLATLSVWWTFAFGCKPVRKSRNEREADGGKTQ